MNADARRPAFPCEQVYSIFRSVPLINSVFAINNDIAKLDITQRRIFVQLGTDPRGHKFPFLVKNDAKPFVKFCVDTGAVASLITERDFDIFRKFGLVMDKAPKSAVTQLTGAAGSPIEIKGVYKLKFTILGKTATGYFFVCPGLTSNLLGMNIIRSLRLCMDPTSGVYFSRNFPVSAISLDTPKFPLLLCYGI